MKSAAPDTEIIDEFYLAALTRFPSREEKSDLLVFIAQRPSRRAETLERMVWALLGSREFSCNH